MGNLRFTKKMLENEYRCSKLISKCETYIPEDSPYCYTFKNNKQYNCPFYDFHPEAEEQQDGYCHLIHNGDWFENNSTMLLWDQCKECCINTMYPDSVVNMILDIFECKINDIEDNEYYDKLSKAIEVIKDYEQEVLENKEYVEKIKKNWKQCDESGLVDNK